MRLEEASLKPPKGLLAFLRDLGEGENGFSGTPVHNGSVSLRRYLQTCIEGADETTLKPGRVPQTIYWLIDSDDMVVGMVKVRHRLVERTRINGGHIGFFIHHSHRSLGYGKQALRLALDELRKTGVLKALLTVYPNNKPSINIIEANGGQFEDCVVDPMTGHKINRYWIESEP